MKSVTIRGKRNTDRICGEPSRCIRSEASKYGFNFSAYGHRDQVGVVNSLYLDSDIEFKGEMTRILNKKISGYRVQDRQKGILDEDKFVTKENILEHLVASRLICHYCNEQVLFLYENVGEKTQWTLDRIDNGIGHNGDNVVIACLGCNIQRRDTNKDKFKFTKNLKIVKTDDI